MTTPRDEIRSLVGKFTSDLEGLVRTAALAAVQNALGAAAPKVALDKTLAASLAKRVVGKTAPAKARTAKANTTAKPIVRPSKLSKALKGKPAKTAKVKSAPVQQAKAAKAGGKAQKRIRRSDDQIDLMANAIHEYVAAHPGSGAEQIKTTLKISKAQWLLPIKRLQDQGRLIARGEKRNTTYTSARSPSKK